MRKTENKTFFTPFSSVFFRLSPLKIGRLLRSIAHFKDFLIIYNFSHRNIKIGSVDFSVNWKQKWKYAVYAIVAVFLYLSPLKID